MRAALGARTFKWHKTVISHENRMQRLRKIPWRWPRKSEVLPPFQFGGDQIELAMRMEIDRGAAMRAIADSARPCV